MKKNDLKTGMVVEIRNGDSFMVLRGCDDGAHQSDILVCLEERENFDMMFLSEFDDTFVYVGEGWRWELDSEFDIVSIYSPTHVPDIFRLLFSLPDVDDFKLVWEAKNEQV